MPSRYTSLRRHLTGARLFFCCLALTGACASLVVTAGSWPGSASRIQLFRSSAAAGARAPQASQTTPLQLFRIQIRPWGLEPKEALWRHDEVNLVLDDTTGTAATIVFERVGTGRVDEVGPGQKRHGSRKFKLPPGDYTYYVKGKPEERGLLTVLRPNQ